MGVIKRFAVTSMVLGTMAMLGGASALAFGGESDGVKVPAQVEQAAPVVAANTTPADNTARWGTPHDIRISE